jgi:hypothetical protein
VSCPPKRPLVLQEQSLALTLFCIPQFLNFNALRSKLANRREDTVVPFTAPESGVYDVTGSFVNLEYATVSVDVIELQNLPEAFPAELGGMISPR